MTHNVMFWTGELPTL